MLSDDIKSDIRDHLGYRFVAKGYYQGTVFPGIFDLGVTDPEFQRLEFKLNGLSPVDEAKLTGDAVGLAILGGQEPDVGNSVSLTIDAPELTPSVTVSVVAVQGDTRLSLAAKLINAINSSAGLFGFGLAAGSPNQPKQVNNDGFVQLKASKAFTITPAFTGKTGVAVDRQGLKSEPQVTVGYNGNEPIIISGLVPILNYLRNACGAATQNADTIRAGDWVRGPELQTRKEIYRHWQQMLSSRLEVPIKSAPGGSFRLEI